MAALLNGRRIERALRRERIMRDRDNPSTEVVFVLNGNTTLGLSHCLATTLEQVPVNKRQEHNTGVHLFNHVYISATQNILSPSEIC